MALEIEGLGTVGGLGAAFTVDAGKGSFDTVIDANAFVDADLNAAETAFYGDDSAVHDVGSPQVEAGEAEAVMHLGTFEALAAVAVLLLAEGYVNLVHLAAVEDYGGGLLVVVPVAAALLVEEQERYSQNHGSEAYQVFPDIVPGDDATCCQNQQDADAKTNDGTCLVAVVEDVIKYLIFICLY